MKKILLLLLLVSLAGGLYASESERGDAIQVAQKGFSSIMALNVPRQNVPMLLLPGTIHTN